MSGVKKEKPRLKYAVELSGTYRVSACISLSPSSAT